jgi:hypothetical protein
MEAGPPARRSSAEPAHGVPFPRLRAFFRRHPALCLLLLAPEVEYLTGSTQSSLLLAQPILFFLFLAQNLASYGAADLLIREARVRWRLGWAGVLFLGACYGIINEGLGVSTLFRPGVGGVGIPGAYEHFLGVNWLNVADLVPIVHPLFSVAIPLLFLDLALPETRGRPLLDLSEIGVAFYALIADTIVTCYFVYRVTGFAAGPILWAVCLGTIGVLVLVARHLPRDLFAPKSATPRAPPLAFALMGASFVWILGLTQAVLVFLHVPVALVIAWALGFAALILVLVLRYIGRTRSAPQVVALSGGLVLSLVPMGILSQYATGVGLVPVLAGDLLAVSFVLWLWKKYGEPRRSIGAEQVGRDGFEPPISAL